jgi:hypothetical protein
MSGSSTMNEDDLKPNRRSARLTISIPIVISGVDVDGNKFSESVRTQVISQHGREITTAHRLAVGTEVLVENRTLRVVAKAVVIKFVKKLQARDLHPVVLRLLEAQNVWGITFPPDNWRPESAG